MSETFPTDKNVESYRALLPSSFYGAEHIRRGGQEFLRVEHSIGGYENLDEDLAGPLAAGGLILQKTETGEHADYYQIPEGAQSLSGVLNSTFADARGEEKREVVLGTIFDRFKQLASHGIAIEKYSGLTRHDVCLGERLKPIIMPLGTMIYETDAATAFAANNRSYKELLSNIIAAAAPEEVEFFKHQRDKRVG